MTYANPDAVATTDWLADHLDDEAVRIVEVDQDSALYAKNHIPGSIRRSWSSDLHHPIRRDYVDQEGFSTFLSDAGVGTDTTVIRYGGNNNWFAAYTYWLVK